MTKDLLGQRFGLLVTLERASNRSKKTRWLCQCDCGNMTTVHTSSLLSGNTKSCGCLRRAAMSAVALKHNGKELVGYYTAHRRVYSLKGKPSSYLCIDCGEQATDWAYSHSDPDELVEQTVVNGVVLGVKVYSPDPTFYEPKCRSCNLKDKLRIKIREKDEG